MYSKETVDGTNFIIIYDIGWDETMMVKLFEDKDGKKREVFYVEDERGPDTGAFKLEIGSSILIAMSLLFQVV